MAFEFKQLFGKKSQPGQVGAVDELPEREDPQAVTSSKSMVQPKPPTGTGFNRRVVLASVIIILCVIAFSFIQALQPPRKLTPQEEAEKRFAEGQKQINNAMPPESVQQFPTSYGSMATFDEKQRLAAAQRAAKDGTPQLGEPVPAVVGSISKASQGGAADYSKGGGSAAAARPELTTEEKQILDARKSPIRFYTQKKEVDAKNQKSAAPNPPVPLPASAGIQMPDFSKLMPGAQEDQNMQDEKRAFAEKQHTKEFYLKSGLVAPFSRYEVKAGTIIPGVLITGINSDLPGRITGQVRENVYDTVSGRHLLIPQGTRIIGLYDSKIAYAQERVLIVWTRLIYPDGYSIDLEGMEGVDLSGYTGLTDEVTNHWGKIIKGVVLSSVFGAGVKIAAGNEVAGQQNFAQNAASGAAQNVTQVGARFTEKNLNIQPTLEIRPGWKFNVFVNKDMILKPHKI